jgi:hypothetical protein
VQALEDALSLLSKPGEAYEQAEPSLRKMLNRAIFWRILIQVVDRQVEVEGVPQEVYTQIVQTAKAVGLPASAPLDAVLATHGARQYRRTRADRRPLMRMASTNEPQRLVSAPGFARRTFGGEGGIRTRDGG